MMEEHQQLIAKISRTFWALKEKFADLEREVIELEGSAASPLTIHCDSPASPEYSGCSPSYNPASLDVSPADLEREEQTVKEGSPAAQSTIAIPLRQNTAHQTSAYPCTSPNWTPSSPIYSPASPIYRDSSPMPNWTPYSPTYSPASPDVSPPPTPTPDSPEVSPPMTPPTPTTSPLCSPNHSSDRDDYPFTLSRLPARSMQLIMDVEKSNVLLKKYRDASSDVLPAPSLQQIMEAARQNVLKKNGPVKRFHVLPPQQIVKRCGKKRTTTAAETARPCQDETATKPKVFLNTKSGGRARLRNC